MIECTKCGNWIFSVAEMHLSFPQGHPDQGPMVECQRCNSQRIIKESAQGQVDHQQVSFPSPYQQQGKREEACN